MVKIEALGAGHQVRLVDLVSLLAPRLAEGRVYKNPKRVAVVSLEHSADWIIGRHRDQLRLLAEGFSGLEIDCERLRPTNPGRNRRLGLCAMAARDCIWRARRASLAWPYRRI